MQEQWSALEAGVAAAQAAAEEAQAAAGKAEADLAALSSAYNDLEAHAFNLEEQLKQQEQQQPEEQQQGGPEAAVSEAEVQARIQVALDQVRVWRAYLRVCCGERKRGEMGWDGLGWDEVSVK